MLLALLIPGAVNSIMLIIVIFMLAGVALDNIIIIPLILTVIAWVVIACILTMVPTELYMLNAKYHSYISVFNQLEQFNFSKYFKATIYYILIILGVIFGILESNSTLQISFGELTTLAIVLLVTWVPYFKLFFTPFVKLDNPTRSFGECIKISWSITKVHKMVLFIISFIIHYLALVVFWLLICLALVMIESSLILIGIALCSIYIIYLTQYMNVVLFNMMYQGLNAIGVYNSY